MRVLVECPCGWQRELGGFYAGKRIRCADCQAVVDVPGNDKRGAYLYPPMRNWKSGRYVKPQGKWVNLERPNTFAPSVVRKRTSAGKLIVQTLCVFAPMGMVILIVAASNWIGEPSARQLEAQPVQFDRPDEAPLEHVAPEESNDSDEEELETDQVDEF